VADLRPRRTAQRRVELWSCGGARLQLGLC
jgi:hypothetical protein